MAVSLEDLLREEEENQRRIPSVDELLQMLSKSNEEVRQHLATLKSVLHKT